MESLSKAKYCKVIMDTSALIYTVKGKVNFLLELENKLGNVKFFVTEKVLEELKILSLKEKSQISRDSRKALELAKSMKVLSSVSSSADEDLVEIAKRENAIVATADSKLKESLVNSKVAVAFPTKGKKIRIEGLRELWGEVV